MAKLQLVQDPAADALLESDPIALLVGMELDQQIPLEWRSPGRRRSPTGWAASTLARSLTTTRMNSLRCARNACRSPVPGSMAKRIQALAQIIVDRYGGDAAAVWASGDPDGAEVLHD